MPSPSSEGSWAKRLPCVLRVPLELVVLDMFHEDDDYLDTIRKICVVIALVVGVLTLISVALGAPSWQKPAEAAYNGVRLAQSATMLVGYFIIRLPCGGVSPRAAVSGLCAVQVVAQIAFTLLTTHLPHASGSLLSLVGAAMVYLPLRGLWMVILFVPYGIAEYHTVSSECTLPRGALLVTEDPVSADLRNQLITRAFLYVFVCVMALAIYAMHDAYARAVAGARASARLSALVAEKMARYDTAGARELLALTSTGRQEDNGASDRGPSDRGPSDAVDVNSGHVGSVAISEEVRGADANLVASLETIVANLEAYRPHLPNWIIDSAPHSTTSEDAAKDFDDASSVRSTRSSRNRSPRTPRSSAQRRSQRLDDPNPEAHRTAHVVRARLGFRVHRGASATTAAVASAFVDVVHAAARHTKAAVHSFIGDTVEVSWNAAAPAPAAKAKCARFLARIRSFAEREDDATAAHVSVGGGAIACRGKVLMAGHGKQHQALLLSVGDYHEQLLSTLAYAGARHRAMLADAQIAAEALDVRSFPVATVAKDGACPADGDAFVPVHQVLTEFAVVVDPADWLDDLQRRTASAQSRTHIPGAAEHPPMDARPMHVLVTQAFNAACARRYAEAAQFLQHVTPAEMHAHPLVARFAQALSTCAATAAAADRRARQRDGRDDFSRAVALAAPAEDAPSPSVALSTEL